jgi:phage tail sheath protein FI
MPQYFSPGVYVEEVDAGPQPIQGVSTSITGAVGVTVQGPTTGKPVLVTSFAEFQTIFGGFIPTPPLPMQNTWLLNATEGGSWWQFPLSVKGFFDNGGQQLYVKRVFAAGTQGVGGAKPAMTAFGGGLIADVAQDANATATTVKLSHLIDIQVGKQISFYAAGQPLPGNPFTVNSYSPTQNTVTLNNPLNFALAAGRDFVVIEPRVPAVAGAVALANQTLAFTAKALGQWGNSISVRVAPMIGASLSMLADPQAGGQPATTQLSANVAANTAVIPVINAAGFVAGDSVRIAGAKYAINAIAGNNITLVAAPTVALAAGTPVVRMRPANAANATTLHVNNAASAYDYAILQLDNGTNKETVIVAKNGVNGEVVTFAPALQHVYYEGCKVRIIEAEVDVQNTVNGTVVASEVWQNLRLHDDLSTSFIVTGVNLQSALINVQTVPAAAGGMYSETDLTKFPTSPSTEWLPLTGGDDALGTLTIEDFIGVDGGSGLRTGIQALADVTDISICIVPGMWSESIQSALINHCEMMRYRFAILDPPSALTIDQVLAFREPFDTKFAALYHPWLEVMDPSVVRNVNIAPSGHMAGIYAQTDNDRGVFKAPANVEFSQITQFAQDVNQAEQDLLNPVGINALRFFPQRGYRVWGARTLSSDSQWKYINVKRLFIYVEASIDQGTQWVVFEPNDEPLWAKLRQTITDFLTTTWRSGALQGTTAAQAFFVTCDNTTMTQDDIDNGRLICVIGIAPVKPAEFVIFRIQQFTQPTSA